MPTALRKVCRAACLLVAVAMVSSSPVGADTLQQRHLETGVNTYFRLSNIPFYQYANHVRRIIAKTRTDVGGPDGPRIVDANAPFEWRPKGSQCRASDGRYRRGVLLIHGLTDSPFAMRDVGQFFLEHCFLVRAIVLPGHGTVPGDLLSVEYGEWIKATRYGLDTFLASKEVHELYMAGFSTGGTLSILAAAQEEPLRGVFLFSPAVKIASSLGFMANWHKAISWAAPDKRWLDIAEDSDYSKYESFTFNAADQIYLLTKFLGNALSKRKPAVPIFMTISEDDATVDAAEGVAFFRSLDHPKSRLILYGNRQANEQDPRVEHRGSAFPAERVLNLSHLSLHISPDNPHYGRNGDYVNCLHYQGEPEKMQACKEGRGNLAYGEVVDESLKGHTLRRITFNPDFGRLTSDMATFLQSLD